MLGNWLRVTLFNSSVALRRAMLGNHWWLGKHQGQLLGDIGVQQEQPLALAAKDLGMQIALGKLCSTPHSELCSLGGGGKSTRVVICSWAALPGPENQGPAGGWGLWPIKWQGRGLTGYSPCHLFVDC